MFMSNEIWSVLKKITDGIKEVAKKVTPKVKKVVEKAAPKVTEQVAKKATEETVDYFFDPETGVIVGSDTTTDIYETSVLDTPLV